MANYTIDNPIDFGVLFRNTETARAKDASQALYEAALAGVEVIVRAAPRDTGSLRGSVHAERVDIGAAILVDAPHAAISDLGSRPHMPPWGPIEAWVRRRLLGQFRVEGKIGPAQPRFGKDLIGPAQRGVGGDQSYGRSRRLTADEKEAADVSHIVEKIRLKIAHHGTKPTFFVRDSMPKLETILVRIMSKRLATR